MIELEIFKMIYKDLNIDKKQIPMIRGFFGNKYKDIDFMHNHDGNNKLFYRYPLVQYKVIENNPALIGIKEGAKTLKSQNIFLEDEIQLGDNILISNQQCVSNDLCLFGESDILQEYKFLTPWIALNQKNISKYKNVDIIDKEELLKSILIGNILSMCKGLGYTVENKLKVKLDVKETCVNLKGTKMLAFTGGFIVNFEIPDYLAIGKSISRGFGTIKKVI